MRNDIDLIRHWRNRNRRSKAQSGWYEWMKRGASLMEVGTDAPCSYESRTDRVSSGDVIWSKPDSMGNEVALYVKRRGPSSSPSSD